MTPLRPTQRPRLAILTNHTVQPWLRAWHIYSAALFLSKNYFYDASAVADMWRAASCFRKAKSWGFTLWSFAAEGGSFSSEGAGQATKVKDNTMTTHHTDQEIILSASFGRPQRLCSPFVALLLLPPLPLVACFQAHCFEVACAALLSMKTLIYAVIFKMTFTCSKWVVAYTLWLLLIAQNRSAAQYLECDTFLLFWHSTPTHGL